MVLPLPTGIGLVPLKAANAASLRHLPGWEKLMMAWAGADRSDAVSAHQAGGAVVDDAQQLCAVVLRLVPCSAERECQTADLRLAHQSQATRRTGF